jgi:hypothetical protein
MAYGVKYRLEFSDHNEKDKKIEILKNNYVGSVLPMIGTNNPCEITWEGDDDFYSPIKGSKCRLNLFVTNTVSYDNFYEYDEREYQVKISYKDSSNNYQTYWIGWLVVDSFSEAITSKPFQISLTAIDGLGTLDSYSMFVDDTSVGLVNAKQYIYKSLNNLDLQLDIYVSQDIFILNPGATVDSIYDVINIKPYTLQKDKFALNNAKKILEQILKFTNARIFQSFGRWYIINNSSYSAQSIKDASATTAQGGTIPTGIRAAEAASLVANNTESIQYVIYNYFGSHQSTTTIDALKQVPSQLLPLDNSLTKEYLRPLNEFNITHETSQFLDVNTIKNSGFENGLTEWTTYSSSGTTSPGELSTDFTKQGNNSFKNSQAQTNETGTRKTLSTSVDVLSQSFLSNTLKINTYFDTNAGFNAISFRFRVKIEDTSSGQVRYWNSSTGSGWGGSDHINIQSVKTGDVWKEFSYNLETYPISGTLTIDLFEPYVQNATGLNAIYYDNITLEFKRLENDRETNFFSSIDGFAYQRIRTTGSNLTGVLEFSDLQLSNNNYNNIITTDFIRPRDDNANFIKSVEQIVTQQVINDYRTNLVRYEGKLYNLLNDPIGLNNKVWINFGSSILREPVSCYIDGMTYNVIKNSFDVIMHIPNQDDDQTSTFKITF